MQTAQYGRQEGLDGSQIAASEGSASKGPAGVAMPPSMPSPPEKEGNVQTGVDLNREFKNTCSIQGTTTHNDGWNEPQTTPRGVANMSCPPTHHEVSEVSPAKSVYPSVAIQGRKKLAREKIERETT